MLKRYATAGGRLLAIASVSLAVLAASGCQDGPLYALKRVNPYFTWKEWRDDSRLGITDHERRQELMSLADSIGTLPETRQSYWLNHLQRLMENDPSPEMRRIAVQAAGNVTAADPTRVIQAGLDDDSFKVRMEACRSLGKRPADANASRLLAEVIGTETNRDVKHAAIKGLGEHDSTTARDALRLALQDRNPATRKLAVASLRESTGEDYGDDPEVWIAALDGKPVEQPEKGLTSRLRDFF